MKEDSLKDLLKESFVQPSEGFTDRLMHKVIDKKMQKLRVRLYVLIASVATLFGGSAFVLAKYGVRLSTMGYSLELPKLAPLVAISLGGFMLVLYLIQLVQSTSSTGQ